MTENIGAVKKEKSVLKFLNDYRKQLSLLKVKSFYANHLCKKNCLEGKLLNNNEACMSLCDEWLKSYFQLKSTKNPDQHSLALVSSTQIQEVQRPEYEKNVANLKIKVKSYVEELQKFVNDKVQKQSKP